MMQAALNLQEDWVSYMLGHDLHSEGWVVEIPSFVAANDDQMMSDVEAEYDDFLTFIADFQSRTKS